VCSSSCGPTGALARVLIMVWDFKSPAEAGNTQGEQNTAPEPEQMKVINHVRMHHIHSGTEHQPAHTHTPRVFMFYGDLTICI